MILKYKLVSITLTRKDEYITEDSYSKVNVPVYKLDRGEYDYLVIGTDANFSAMCVHEIANVLQIDNAKFLFDSYVRLGNEFNRYISCDYRSDANFIRSFSVVSERDLDDNIKKISRIYIRRHLQNA